MEDHIKDKQTVPCAQPPAVYATNLDLRRSLPENVISTALSQYYNSEHIMTTPHIEVEKNFALDLTPDIKIDVVAKILQENVCYMKCTKCGENCNTENELMAHQVSFHQSRATLASHQLGGDTGAASLSYSWGNPGASAVHTGLLCSVFD